MAGIDEFIGYAAMRDCVDAQVLKREFREYKAIVDRFGFTAHRAVAMCDQLLKKYEGKRRAAIVFRAVNVSSQLDSAGGFGVSLCSVVSH